jgi:hypothetical protein
MPHSGYPFVEKIQDVLFVPSGATRVCKVANEIQENISSGCRIYQSFVSPITAIQTYLPQARFKPSGRLVCVSRTIARNSFLLKLMAMVPARPNDVQSGLTDRKVAYKQNYIFPSWLCALLPA